MIPPISDRGIRMPDSPIRKLTPYANLALKKGIKIYHLNIGQPDIPMPKSVLDALKTMDFDFLPYSKSEGNYSLRQAAVKYYKNYDINIDIDQIMVTSGASEAIFFLLNAIANVGDEIITPEPFYANYLGFAETTGVNITPAPSAFEENFRLPLISDFEKKINPKTKAILICNPGNPTGNVYSKKNLEELGNLAQKHGLYLIVDEVYREFAYDNVPLHSVLHLEHLDEHTVMIDSVSKRFNLCGARIGFILSKNKRLMNTILKFAQARLSPPSIGQEIATAVLKNTSKYLNNVTAEFRERKNLLVRTLRTIPQIKVSNPQGAFYCMVRLPIDDADDFARWLLESFNLDNETIMIAPASGFYISPNRGKNEVRIAYVLNKTDLLRSVEILREGLKKYTAR